MSHASKSILVLTAVTALLALAPTVTVAQEASGISEFTQSGSSATWDPSTTAFHERDLIFRVTYPPAVVGHSTNSATVVWNIPILWSYDASTGEEEPQEYQLLTVDFDKYIDEEPVEFYCCWQVANGLNHVATYEECEEFLAEDTDKEGAIFPPRLRGRYSALSCHISDNVRIFRVSTYYRATDGTCAGAGC